MIATNHMALDPRRFSAAIRIDFVSFRHINSMVLHGDRKC